MHLRELNLHGFRNLQNPLLKPAAGFNVIWGDNAQGKTNLLEAIYLLAQLKSFRSNRRETLIKNGLSAARLTAGVSISGVHHRFELTLTRDGRSGQIDGKQIVGVGEMLGRLKAVLFAPEEISLVRGSPAGRRSMLDRAVFQVDSGFLPLAREYQRCLKQRNHLLKKGDSDEQLLPWSLALAESGARLRTARHHFLQRLRPLLQNCYRTICGGREEVDLGFAGRVGLHSNDLLEDMERSAARERQYQQTLVGPHRDDLQFRIDGRPLKNYGSQGQQRSFLLAFKTAQVLDLESQVKQAPLLLLDDLTSELDAQRRAAFFEFLLAHRGQVFLTTTDIRSLTERGLEPDRCFHIVEGAVQADHDE